MKFLDAELQRIHPLRGAVIVAAALLVGAMLDVGAKGAHGLVIGAIVGALAAEAGVTIRRSPRAMALILGAAALLWAAIASAGRA